MTQSLLPKMWREDKEGGDLFSSLHREIDRVFEGFSKPEHWPFPAFTKEGKLSPRVNVSESNGEIEVTAELPGVEEKQIDVSLADDMLTIKAEKKSETERKDKDYHLIERSYGSFERSLRLPCEVVADKVDATFKNGVLTVVLAKSPEAKSKVRKIAVKSH